MCKECGGIEGAERARDVHIRIEIMRRRAEMMMYKERGGRGGPETFGLPVHVQDLRSPWPPPIRVQDLLFSMTS